MFLVKTSTITKILMKASIVFKKHLRKQSSKTKRQKNMFKHDEKTTKQAGQKLWGNKLLHRSICAVCIPNPHRGYDTMNTISLVSILWVKFEMFQCSFHRNPRANPPNAAHVAVPSSLPKPFHGQQFCRLELS